MINNKLEKDKDIFVMSADFGTASLDITRDKFKILFIAGCQNKLCLTLELV